MGRLRDFLGGRRTRWTYSECRRCGLSVGDTTEHCPQCEVESIVRYDVG